MVRMVRVKERGTEGQRKRGGRLKGVSPDLGGIVSACCIELDVPGPCGALARP